MWRSLVSRLVRVQEASGSNPDTPTMKACPIGRAFLFLRKGSYLMESGKQVLVYRFGGAGNDWCFVYLPASYNPEREQPYPFVICNHGNGWVMDGSVQKANWTKRTMFLPADDPDLLSHPSQYNVCEDPGLLFSNPTIEALLSAGYIVCGAQNYGDLMYGNAQCRQACMDFYLHMTKTYHVTERCHMIGASNGAMTTLNTLFLLGEKVESVILQYPLTCLEAQYRNHPPHREHIENRYGISQDDVENGIFQTKLREFDPLYANVENGIKTGYFPRLRIYYSETDTVVGCTHNTLLLCRLLENSGIPFEKIRVDTGGVLREHGDYAHFDPAGYLEWFQRK